MQEDRTRVVAGINRKYKLAGQMRKQRQVIWKNWWMPKSRKVRKDRLPSSVIQKVDDWFISSTLAKEVPCKRFSQQDIDRVSCIMKVAHFKHRNTGSVVNNFTGRKRCPVQHV